MDTLLYGVWINLFYVGGGRTVQILDRPPVEPVFPSADMAPALYPIGGGWPAYLRRNASHLFQCSTFATHQDYDILGGERPHERGEIVCMPSNTTHRGVGPEPKDKEERFCIFWTSFCQRVSFFIFPLLLSNLLYLIFHFSSYFFLLSNVISGNYGDSPRC
jgi:hypothetical protein